MKILKYINDENNFCLVHKTKIFVYYFIFKDNKYSYYESYLKKKFSKNKEDIKQTIKKRNHKNRSFTL